MTSTFPTVDCDSVMDFDDQALNKGLNPSDVSCESFSSLVLETDVSGGKSSSKREGDDERSSF